MNPTQSFPTDIYTEPVADVHTLANLGPLTRMAGVWRGTQGMDRKPKAGGPKEQAYVGRIELQPIDPQTNGPQLFYGLRYHMHINNREEKITFHDQVGYWLWEPATGLLLQSLTIPRGQALLAAGRAQADDTRFTVTATRGDTAYGIVSNGFLEEAFRTDHYRCTVVIHGADSWSYELSTTLVIPGLEAPFDHHDSNTLSRVAPPEPNPLALASED